MKRFELTDLELEEISAVDRPANPGAKIAFWKRDGRTEDSAMMEETEKVGLAKRLLKLIGVGTDDLAKSEDDIVADTATEKLKALEAEVAKLKAERGADEVAKAIAEALKADDPSAELEKLEGQVAELKKSAGDKDERIAELEKQLSDAQKGAEDVKTRKAFRDKLPPGMRKAFDEMDEDERRKFEASFAKGVEAGDPVAKALEKASSENEKLNARIAKLEGETEVSKAKTELADLSSVVDVNTFAEKVVKLRRTDPDAAEELVKDLRAASERVKTASLFSQAGADVAKAPNAEGELDKAVAKYLETHPDVSKAQAESEVLKIRPALYDSYLAEKGV